MAVTSKAVIAWLVDKAPAKRWQDASRLALGVLILSTLGFCLYDVVIDWQYAHDLSSSLQWGAVTVLLISAPVLGKVVRTGLERVIGTLAGGLVAYLAALANTTAVYVLFTGLVALVGHMLGGALGLEYSGKLFGITYLIIAPTAFVNGGAHVVVISRVAGVLSGIAVTFLLSCIWFPTPASEQAIDNLHKGLTALHSLTQHTWSGLQASRCSAEAQLLLRAISIAQSGALPDDAAFGAGDASMHKTAAGKPVELRAVSAPAAAAGVEMAQRAQQSVQQEVQQQEVQQDQQGEQQQTAGVPLDSPAGDGTSKMAEAERGAQASPFWAYANASMERTTKSVTQWLSTAVPGSPNTRSYVDANRTSSGAGAWTPLATAAPQQMAAGAQGSPGGKPHTLQQAQSFEPLTIVTDGATVLSSGRKASEEGQDGSTSGATNADKQPQSPAVLPKQQREQLRANIDSACEAALTTLHTCCNAAMEGLKDAANEYYAGKIGHHRIYLPLLSLGKRGRHSFHMPAAEFTATQIATRHCARLVWTLHLTLQEGFDQQMMALLRTRYPVHLLDKLQQASTAFVHDCEAAMQRSQRSLPLPVEPVPRRHLEQFHKAVRVLLEISESQRHQVIDHVRRFTVPPSPPRRNDSTPSARFSFSDMAVDEQEAPAIAAAVSGVMQAQAAATVGAGHDRASSRVLQDASDSPQQEASNTWQQQRQAQQQQLQQEHGQGHAEDMPSQHAGSTLAGGGVAAGFGSVVDLAGTAQADSNRASISAPSHSNTAAADEVPSFLYTQSHLHGLRLHVDASSGATSAPQGVSVRQDTSGDGLVSPRPSSVDTALPAFLQRVDTPRLFFPDNSEGFIAKIKWYSFQFLMEQLVEVFDELHASINALLPKLPGAVQCEDGWQLPK